MDRTTAEAEAAALATRMGEGWEPVVVEVPHLGWAYKATKADFTVSPEPTREGEYTAWFKSERQLVARGATPEEAFGAVVEQAHSLADQLLRDVAPFAAKRRPPNSV